MLIMRILLISMLIMRIVIVNRLMSMRIILIMLIAMLIIMPIMLSMPISMLNVVLDSCCYIHGLFLPCTACVLEQPGMRLSRSHIRETLSPWKVARF